MKPWEIVTLALNAAFGLAVGAGFLVMWINGTDHIVFYVNMFREQAVETVLMVVIPLLGVAATIRQVKAYRVRKANQEVYE